MKTKTISLISDDAINKSLDKSDLIPTQILDTSVDDQEAAITIKPPIPGGNEALKVLRNYSIWHKKCLKAVAQDVTLNGHRIVATNEESNEESDHLNLLDDIFNDYNNSQALFKTIRDFRTYTHGCFEIAVNKKGELRGFRHIRSVTIEMCEDGEKALQTIGGKSKYFKVYGNTKPENKGKNLDSKTGDWGTNIPDERKASTVVWLTDGCEDSDYYHEPEYLPAVPTILSEDALESYNYNGLITNGIPNYLIFIAGYFQEGKNKDGETWDEALENDFKDVPNKPGTAIVQFLKKTDPEDKMEIVVEKLGEPLREGSYLKLAEANMTKILASHEVPPSRLGITINGPLSGSVDEIRNKEYDEKVVNPIQLMLDSILNELIADEEFKLNITDFKHEFKRVDTKNVKGELEIAKDLVNFGAMTPAQLLQAFGGHFNLKVDIQELITKFPELDSYYMNGQPLGMAPNPAIQKAVMNGYEAIPLKVARILDLTADKIEGLTDEG